METVFWVCAAIMGYTYIGYGLLIGLLNILRRKPAELQDLPDAKLPTVSVVIPAWNEEDILAQKIDNTLALDYPEELLQIIVITDGSTDASPRIAADADRVEALHQSKRSGKVGALNRARRFLTGEITIITDANAMLNRAAIRELVRPFQQVDVGGVAGEKRVQVPDTEAGASAGEGMYWRYESQLKAWDANLYSVTGAAGELMALRTSVFEEVPADSIIEDYYISLRINSLGYRVAYAPNAYALETGSASLREEQKRKIRIAAGGFQASWRMRQLLNPFRFGFFSIQVLSHRVLRWTLAPLSFFLLLPASGLAALQVGGCYTVFFFVQVAAYGWALLGYYLPEDRQLPGTHLAAFILMMHLSVVRGFWRYLRGRQKVTWERAQRAVPVVERL